MVSGPGREAWGSGEGPSLREVVLVRGAWSPERDAVARAMRELAESMQRRGLRVTVVAASGTYPVDLSREWAAPRGTEVESGRARRWNIATGLFRYLSESRVNATVIAVDDPLGVAWIVRAVRLVAAPKSVQVNWSMDLFHTQDARSRRGHVFARATSAFKAGIERLSLRAGDSVVVLGECMAQTLRGWVSATRIVTIPIWQPDLVEPEASDSGPRTATQRTGADEPLRVLYAGHATHRHPIAPWLVQMAQAMPEVQFLVVGTGPQASQAHEAATKLRLSNLTVEGRKGRTQESILNTGDVHLVALAPFATGTCVPSKVYAGMTAGRPVLFLGDRASQGAIDVLRANAGVVLDPNDLSGACAFLRAMAVDRARATFGDNGRRFFLEQRTIDRATDNWCTLIERLQLERTMVPPS